MHKIYYLKSCTTCQRIIKELGDLDSFTFREIKSAPITAGELAELYAISKSYESLFSKRAVLYRERGLKEKNLQEADYKALLLEHYTFLKRPFILYDEQLFIGNSKKTIAAAKEAIAP